MTASLTAIQLIEAEFHGSPDPWLLTDAVCFDTLLFSKSTGPPADKHQHHYKEFREEVVLDEHVDQYREDLFEWEDGGGWETDWMDW